MSPSSIPKQHPQAAATVSATLPAEIIMNEKTYSSVLIKWKRQNKNFLKTHSAN